MQAKKTWVVAGALSLLTLVSGQALADEARELLQKMSEAVRSLNYDGTFVFLHGGQLESMRIIHQADEQGERERLVSLNGAAREVVRDNESVTCFLPDSQSVMVDKRRPRTPFPAALNADLDALSGNYEFAVLGDDRIAGAAARAIAIRPRDAYRYGYRLWLDKASHMLLKSDLMDPQGRAMEQVMFTHFELRDSISPQELEPDTSGDGFTWHGRERPPGTQESSDEAAWAIDNVPAGFALTHHNRHHLPGSRGRVEHMVFSDGLASVSVYVEPGATARKSLEGLSSMGAVNAFGARHGDHQVTVVGEVPGATVEMIARSARPRN